VDWHGSKPPPRASVIQVAPVFTKPPANKDLTKRQWQLSSHNTLATVINGRQLKTTTATTTTTITTTATTTSSLSPDTATQHYSQELLIAISQSTPRMLPNDLTAAGLSVLPFLCQRVKVEND